MTVTRRIPWLSIGLLLCAALVVVLAWQNRGLRQQHTELQKRAFEPYVGEWMPEIRGVALDGRTVRLGTAPERFQVLYFFTPSCPYCRQSAPAVRALADRLAQGGAGVQMIGVADGETEQVRRYAAEHRFRFPIVPLRDQRALALFKANSVPLLVVIDAKGQVRHSHLGVLDKQDALGGILAAIDSPDKISASPTARSNGSAGR